ncbi:hypothetical protein NHF46_20395 [Arthrobacter alpinus]|nr:hypothetical protein [Arthrobacter alpinus]
MKFTPTASTEMSTIFSAGGNFYIRSQGGKLRYGFDSNSGSAWATHMEETTYPSLNTEHVLSFHYLPSGTSTTLSLMLDGAVLPSVTSTDPAKNSASLGNAFVFGNEVNPKPRRADSPVHCRKSGWPLPPPHLQRQTLNSSPAASTSLLDVSYDGTVAAKAYSPPVPKPCSAPWPPVQVQK